MTGAAKRKGDRAEREAADLLSELLGVPVRRKLGAGRSDDTGDLDGVPGHVIQVADWKNTIGAVINKPLDAELQRLHAGQDNAAALIRIRGGKWRVVLTLDQWARYVAPKGHP